MFADDLIIFSESHIGLQNALYKLELYCEKWQLTVNLSKTKVMIFNTAGRILRKFSFTFNNEVLEISDRYCYLGILFVPSGKFSKACEKLCEQARKAIFKLKTWDLRNNVTTALKLFQTLIQPILLYGSEAWAPFVIKNSEKLNFMHVCDTLPQEKIFLKFCKYLLGVNKHATNAAVRGELGTFPLLIPALSHCISYWLSLNSQSSLSKEAYLDSIQFIHNRKMGWAFHINQILQFFNLENVWFNQGSLYPNKINTILKNNMHAKFIICWENYIGISPSLQNIKTSTKMRTYNLFKKEFTFENYLNKSFNLRLPFTKLRISTHDLHIETGRYNKPSLPPDQRICQNCNLNAIENEKHFIINCPKYDILRKELFEKITTTSNSNFNILNEDEKFYHLMNYNFNNTDISTYVLKFINCSFLLRNGLL